jgi:hypothetical protein
MKKLTDILNEIKVNTPSSTIIVTEKGEEATRQMSLLHKSADFFNLESGNIHQLADGTPSERLFFATLNLWIFSDRYGEGIIKLNNPTTEKEYLSKYTNVWDDDIESAKNNLKQFEEQGLIKIIK